MAFEKFAYRKLNSIKFLKFLFVIILTLKLVFKKIIIC